jgi:hypothetical protein
MKKLIVCLFAVCALTVPICAVAWDTTVEPTTAVVDIKGFGNQFADYSTACLNVESITTTTSTGTSEEWKEFNNSVGDVNNCSGPDCGMDLSQGSNTFTEFDSVNTTTLTGKNLVGSADMTSTGGLAACSTPGIMDGTSFTLPVDGSLYQTHTVNNTVSGELCPGVTGTASYTGTQTLDLKIGPTY